MNELVSFLLDYRRKNNLTQAEMAAQLGIGHRTYQAIEQTGVVKKNSDLDKIKAKTGYADTQIPADLATLMQSISSLVQSNAILAQTNAGMYAQITAMIEKENQRASLPTPADLIKAFASYGVGKNLWKSQVEGVHQLHNILYEGAPIGS